MIPFQGQKLNRQLPEFLTNFRIRTQNLSYHGRYQSHYDTQSVQKSNVR